MKLSLGCVLLSCFGLHAQSVSSPPGFLSQEGELWAHKFGNLAEGRYMFLDGEWRNTALSIKEIAYRLDDRPHRPTDAIGRQWTSVTLDVSECVATTTNQTFSLVPTSSPTRVFSSPVAWATMVGSPPTSPAAWGGVRGGLRFPFRSAYVHTGRRDICSDFRFAGGRMANRAPWRSLVMYSYFLDGYFSGPLKEGVKRAHGGGFQFGGCVDSNAGQNYGGGGIAFSQTYGPSHPQASFRNKFHFFTQSLYTAAGRPVIHAVGLAGSAVGFPFPGVTCNRVHVDLSQPYLFIPLRADTASTAVANYDFGMAPYSPALVGTRLWFQPAWDDSTSGAFMLGRAMETELATLPLTYSRAVLYQYQPSLPRGLGPYDGSEWNPIARYGR